MRRALCLPAVGRLNVTRGARVKKKSGARSPFFFYALRSTHYALSCYTVCMTYDSIIIGGGPGGLAAAIYMARQKLSFLLLTDTIGGQTLWSSEVENYLGFHLINGSELVDQFKAHLKDYKDDFELKDGVRVASVMQDQKEFIIKLESGEEYRTKTVLVATGEKHRELNVPGEKVFYGRGVTYCATCDAPLFKDKTVVVVGGGNSAMEAALHLEKYAKHVTILTINEGLTGDTVMKKKIEEHQKISVLAKAKTTKIFGDTFVTGMEYETTDGKKEVLEVEGVFIEIGLIPVSGFIDIVRKNKWGEIEVDTQNATSVEGIWAAGDVTTVTEKQIAVAVGEGSKAALGIIRYLHKS